MVQGLSFRPKLKAALQTSLVMDSVLDCQLVVIETLTELMQTRCSCLGCTMLRQSMGSDDFDPTDYGPAPSDPTRHGPAPSDPKRYGPAPSGTSAARSSRVPQPPAGAEVLVFICLWVAVDAVATVAVASAVVALLIARCLRGGGGVTNSIFHVTIKPAPPHAEVILFGGSF